MIGSLTVPAKSVVRAESVTEELGQLIGKTRRLVWNKAAKRLSEAGDSLMSCQVLGHLVREGKLTQSELAQALSQHPAGVSRVLDELEKQGCVLRTRDTRDRRRVYVVASARGKRRYASAWPEVVTAVGQALEPLSDAERHALRTLLRKVVAHGAETLAVPARQ